MITVELTKDDLISLIKGTCPKDFTQISRLEKLNLGHYIGGFNDKWYWNSKNDLCWNLFSEQELYELYLTLK